MPYVFNPFTGQLDFTNPGSSFDPHSPGPIGDVTASTGAFTSITSTPGNDATGLTITGGSITGSGMTPFLSITGTWNTTGTPTAMDVDVTDTASGFGSRLMHIKRNGATVFQMYAFGVAFYQGYLFVFKLIADNYQFTNGSFFMSGADGVFRLTNSAQNDMGRLQFGVTDNTGPALKRSSAILQARLADDSAFTILQATLRTSANAVAEIVVPTHTLVIQDASGTSYKVIAVAA
jgi:hypothetical protein